ncbi:hypothetical protein ACQ4LE_009878 [Meloidogyne hapla]
MTEAEKAEVLALKRKLRTAEEQLAAEEQKRIAAEEKLVAAEDQRIAEEERRVAAEEQLVAAEEQLVAAEEQLVVVEDQRIAAEERRVAAEEQLEQQIAERNALVSEFPYFLGGHSFETAIMELHSVNMEAAEAIATVRCPTILQLQGGQAQGAENEANLNDD